ncbi:MAG TPA: NUDIX hydrolase [Acidimicrobiales bacterium]
MTRFSKLAEEGLYRGPVISLARGRFAGPEGELFERDVVHHPGAVSVVPVVEDGAAALLVVQYRAAVDAELLEIPAGKRDVDGEEPVATARRELEEEVGRRAGRMELLARFYNSPGFCDEDSWVFLALDLEACEASAQGLEERHMVVRTVTLDDVPGMIARQEIRDAKTIIGLTLARERLA